MILLTKNDGEQFVINCEHIQTMHSIPETKITTFSGQIFLVRDSRDEVMSKVIEYKRQCFDCQIKKVD